MRQIVFAAALTLAACGGEKTTSDPSPQPGDPGGGDSVAGDTSPGDTLSGDPTPGDALSGDTSPGDGVTTATIMPSTQFCAAGGKVAGTSYKGTVCLSPLGSGGPVSSNSSYKWIPGPAHIVQGQ